MSNLVKKYFWMVLVSASVFGAAAGFVSAGAMVDSAQAQTTVSRDPRELIKESGKAFGQDDEPTDPRQIIFSIVRLLLTIIGTALMLMFLYAGYMWWSAGGSEDKVTKAKATLRNAVIGMLIVGFAYSLVSFVFRSVFKPLNVNVQKAGEEAVQKRIQQAGEQAQ